MAPDSLKSELIEWLAKLEDEETIDFLKQVEETGVANEDGASHLSDEMKAGITRGLKDVDNGKVTPHDTIRDKYGL